MSSPVGTEAQADAIAAARKFIAARQRPDWHTVAAVVLTAAGRRHIGINLDSVLPRASVCAEPVAFGMAVAEDADDRVVFCAAVNRRGEVIPPCGPCRELMMDFARDAIVGLPLAGGDPMAFRTMPMRDLMPVPVKPALRKGA